MRAFRLPPAVRETGMRNAEGLSAKLTEGVVPLHNTAAAIVYPHVNTTSSAAQTDSPTACAARLFGLCACKSGSVASA